MIIPVAAAVGAGATELAAFDAALAAAGVADRNLLYLSSVLPPGSDIRRVDRIESVAGVWGDRLYVVMAQARTSIPGAEVWAGIGWARAGSGRGLLVEHHADTETALKNSIEMSLSGLLANRPGVALPHQDAATAGTRCTGQPVCALAVAVFKAESWYP